MEQNKFPWWIVFVGVGCLVILCCCCLVAGGVAFYSINNQTSSFGESGIEDFGPLATEWILPEEFPLFTEEAPPPLVIPTTEEDEGMDQPSLTGNQRLDEYSLFDDFSSQALSWPVYNDGEVIIQYESDAYSIQVKTNDFFDWASIPVTFWPQEIRFEVYTSDLDPKGTFGVFCQYQDEDNNYFVEFDLAERLYVIGEDFQDERVILTPPNPEDNDWHTTDAIRYPPTEINTIYIQCYPQTIWVYINDEFVEQVDITKVIDAPGEMAFFVYTYPNAGPEGYKVYFDNVDVWHPIQ